LIFVCYCYFYLLGFASVINHMSELMAYFFVHQLVTKFGHIKIFYAGLFGNFIRFVYVSLLSEPYWILPFEFIQGVTHALVWATATSYFSQAVPEDLRSTAQGMLQGIHFGLGRGCGTLFGGLFITWFGTKLTFFLYGIICCFTMIAYIIMNNIVQQQQLSSNNSIQQNGINANEEIIPELQNVNNPMLDSNFYYQPSSSSSNSSKNNNNNQTSQLNTINK
jgi:MFS family permease